MRADAGVEDDEDAELQAALKASAEEASTCACSRCAHISIFPYFIHPYIHIYIRIHTCTYIYIYAYKHAYIYTYIHLYINRLKSRRMCLLS